MDPIQSKIQAAAPRNQDLLRALSETDYAKPALEQQNRYINDLEQQIQRLEKHLKALEEKRKKELKEHEKYRDSVMKRFAFKVSRKQEKFNAQAEKEEREYFEVLQEEHKAQEMRKNLGSTLAEAQRQRSELENTATSHDQAQRSLDELYDSDFRRSNAWLRRRGRKRDFGQRRAESVPRHARARRERNPGDENSRQCPAEDECRTAGSSRS